MNKLYMLYYQYYKYDDTGSYDGVENHFIGLYDSYDKIFLEILNS